MKEKIKDFITETLEFILSLIIGFVYIGSCLLLSSLFCIYVLGICLNCPPTDETEFNAIAVIGMAVVIFFIPIGIGEYLSERNN